MEKPIAVIILAAGKGKRLGGYHQKTLHKIAGRSLLAHLLNTISGLKPSRIVVVVGHQKEQVIEQLKNEPVIFVEQKQLLGTGHAVMQAESALRDFCGIVLVLCGDVPFLTLETLKQLETKHRANNAASTILTAIVDSPAGYGRIKRDKNGNVVGIVEELNATAEEKGICEINTGVYMFDRSALFQTLPLVKPDSVKNEYYLTDVISIMCSKKLVISTYTTPTPDEALGINTPEDLMRALQYAKKAVFNE